MIIYNNNIIYQTDSIAVQKDTTQSYTDSLSKNDSVNAKTELQSKDTLKKQTVDSLENITQNPIFINHIIQIPDKTRFIFSDIPTYKAIEINSIISQKYTSLQVENFYFSGKKYQRTTSDWMVITGIISLIVLGWVYGFYKKYLVQLFQSAYDDKVSFKLMEERSSVTERVSFALNTLFVLNTGLFIYEILLTFRITIPALSGFPLFVSLSGIIAIIYLFKYILYLFIGFILDASKEISEIIHSIFLYNKIFSIFLIPIIVFLPFIEEKQAIYLAYTGIAFFAISFLFRIFRGFQICMKINFSISYFILYLCAFEILPLLIIGKFFYKLINS